MSPIRQLCGELAARLKPDGLMILSTPNRTAASKLFLVEAAERLGQVPRGTHDWDKFLTPEEVARPCWQMRGLRSLR
jgi:2-polyprenyl-6-hydroxyphenyl methylase/3-demethylubiquinone-9 3-methyltransferase